MTERDFIPALRFDALTALFDSVAAVTVRDGAVKRRVLEYAAIAPSEAVLGLGAGTVSSPTRGCRPLSRTRTPASTSCDRAAGRAVGDEWT